MTPASQIDLEEAIAATPAPAPKARENPTGNRMHALAERGPDLYETPLVAIRSLIAVEPLPPTIWEPACGRGAIVIPLRETGRHVIATDLNDFGCPDATARIDFLLERTAPAGTQAIVMNPPYSLANEFVAHAITLCGEVHALLRLAYLEGLRWFPESHDPRGYDLAPHLARTTVFVPRLPMMHRDGWTGPRNESSGIPFAWYCFRRYWAAHGGQATVRWHDWRPYAEKPATSLLNEKEVSNAT